MLNNFTRRIGFYAWAKHNYPKLKTDLIGRENVSMFSGQRGTVKEIQLARYMESSSSGSIFVEIQRPPFNYNQFNLHDNYSREGLRILAFPCNQFGGQEPWLESEIKEFVKTMKVEFDMFSKIEVNGSNAHPLFKYLKSNSSGLLGSSIKWNFTKFLVDKQGHVVKRLGPNHGPSALEDDIKNLLSQ
ncbi:hypothetical protein GJ496_005094 [Pomphorhynchus laevis]|nr:hypothetical protein GJ496_005094 [Pomphorhynchus laevis]